MPTPTEPGGAGGASRPTPLHAEHLALGATMTDFAGWSMPLRYAGETAEHRAVRSTAGLFDLSHMGEIEVTGPLATLALDRALVSDMTAVKVGKAKYTMLCAEDGGILDDLIVYRLAEERWLVVANAANTAVVADELTRRAGGADAAVTDRTAEYALVAVQGPGAVDVLAPLVDVDLAGIRYYAADRVTVAGVPALLARTGYTGEDGFEIFCPAAEAGRVWAAARAAGAGFGLVPAGLASRDSLRLEAGMPLYGHELTREVTPAAAGLGRVVAGTEAEFVGREALVRRAAEGEPRRLVGLVGAGRRPFRAGYPVRTEAGAEIGVLTSGALSPTLGHPIALGYLDRAHAGPDTAVRVDVRGRAESARVVEPPFYRRPR